MKHHTKIIVSLLITLALGFSQGNAQSSFGLFTGLATPSELVNQVYNSDLIQQQNVTGVLLREATRSGYTIGARIRQNIDEQFWFIGGLSLARFPQSVIPIVNQANQLDTLAIMTTVQNVIPIQAGMMYQFNKGLVSLYAIGDVTYNYLMNSVDVQYNQQSFPLPPEEETIERIGFGVGLGIDVYLKVITASLEAKMNTINFIGRTTDEAEKRFFSLTLGVHFGQTQSDKP